MNPDCFGREYVDTEGVECPYEECLLRYECKDVFGVAKGFLRAKKEGVVSAPHPVFKIDKAVKRKRSGYVKPGRLLYKDEGTLRDKLLFLLRDFLVPKGFSVKTTKCLHSFTGPDNKFVLKVDTRRKNSVLLYVPYNLYSALDSIGFSCRELFESERPNFPQYLQWVVVLRGECDFKKFTSAFDSSRPL
jgi:hypothetical protein